MCSSEVMYLIFFFFVGYIANIRDDGCHVVYLTNWALAQGQSPTLFLREEALR
jgi:hypothetical protein